MTINFKLNGKELETQKGQTILQAAAENGVEIPTLCYHKDLNPTGSCRICVVDVKDSRFMQAACTTQVWEGMEIETHNETARLSRKNTLELMLANHPQDCITCEANGACELQDLAYEYKVEVPSWGSKGTRYLVDSDPNPFIRVDMNRCILCGRCVQACAEIQVRDVWGFAERGFEKVVVAGADVPMLEAGCESCGQCVAYCPTGALDNKLNYGIARAKDVEKVTTTCTYCGVGCQFDLLVKNEKVIGVESNPAAPVNGMALCVKGRYGYDFIHHEERLTKPLVRRYLLENGNKPKGQLAAGSNPLWDWVETSWEQALDIAAEKLDSSRKTHGADSIGILTSAKCTNEENYLMNKFARQVVGTNNIDHCARLCHSSTVAGLATSMGSGAMTNSMDDISQQAEAFFIIGSNTSEQHPVFGTMLRRAIRFRGAKLIVADPRRIDMVDFATLHLRHRGGTDIALINGLMHIILKNGWEDKAFIAERTENFDEFYETVMRYTPELTEEITGVPQAQLHEAAEIMGNAKPMAVIWAMGITQHITGVHNVFSLANLQMLLGNMGVPGGGVNPLRGQNNVQGACDLGGLPDVYPGYQKVNIEANQKKFEQAWGVALNPTPGKTATELVPGILEGTTSALYVMAENPVMSEPDTHHVRESFEQLDFMVLQEIFPTESAVYADVLLPGASFAEKTGTITNTERRIQMVREAIPPLGDSRPDWQITAELGKRMMAKRVVDVDAAYAGWEYRSPAEVMTEAAALTPIYGGVSHTRIEAGERIQWPCTAPEHPGTKILHVGQFARGLGKFHAVEHVPPAEQPDDEYPFVMSTGRVLYHWHGGEMTRRTNGLNKVYGDAMIELNPEDAARMGADDESYINVTSRRGTIQAQAWVTQRVPPGMVYANFHFPDSSANILTQAVLDPIAKIPEYKVTAVRVEKARE